MKKKIVCLMMVAALLTLGGCQTEEKKETEQNPETEQSQETIHDHAHDHETEQGSEQAAAVNLKIGLSAHADEPHYQAAEQFAKEIEELSNGEIKATLYASGKLGTDEELLDAIDQDTKEVDIVIADISSFAKYDSKLDISQLPFLFESLEAAEHFMEGDIQREAEQELSYHNMRALAYYSDGFRYLTTTQAAIDDASELQGMKIATTEDSIGAIAIRALGAMTMDIDSGELASGLQQGRFDGYEGTLDSIYNSRMYQFQKNLIMTKHSYSASVFVMAESTFSELDPEYQNMIEDTALSSSYVNRQLVQQQEQEMLDEIKNAGVRILYPDFDTFWEKAQSVVKGYSSKYEGLSERLVAWRND